LARSCRSPHVGKVVEIDGGLRQVARGDQFKPLSESFSPVEHRFGVEVPYRLVEETILIAKGCDEAAWMTVRQSAINSDIIFEADEKAVQRVLVKLVGTAEQIVEQRILPLDVADEQSPGELVLILEVIEEAALGDADGGSISESNDSGPEPLMTSEARQAKYRRSVS
jgi:hypothetical protein